MQSKWALTDKTTVIEIHSHLFHQLKDVFLLHRIHPELLQLLPSAAQQLLARIQVLLDRMDLLKLKALLVLILHEIKSEPPERTDPEQ